MFSDGPFVDCMIKEIVKEFKPDLKYEITGSYRRGAPDSGDIDILVTSKSGDSTIFKKVVTKLKKI